MRNCEGCGRLVSERVCVCGYAAPPKVDKHREAQGREFAERYRDHVRAVSVLFVGADGCACVACKPVEVSSC